jgi:hypothetical protein
VPSPWNAEKRCAPTTTNDKRLCWSEFRGPHTIQRELLAPFVNDQRDQLVAALDELRLALSSTRDPNGRWQADAL